MRHALVKSTPQTKLVDMTIYCHIDKLLSIVINVSTGPCWRGGTALCLRLDKLAATNLMAATDEALSSGLSCLPDSPVQVACSTRII